VKATALIEYRFDRIKPNAHHTSVWCTRVSVDLPLTAGAWTNAGSRRFGPTSDKRGVAKSGLFDHLAGEGCDKCIDLLLIRTLASGVDARTRGVADPKHNFMWSRRVMDQHRGRIEGIEIPTLVEGPIDEIHGRARRAHLGVAWNNDAAAFDRAAHRHAESRMDHRGAMLKIAADADQRRLGVGAQLRRARAERRQRRVGQRNPELERIVDQRLEVGAGRLAGERVLEDRGDRDASQRGTDARALLTVYLLDGGACL